MADSLTTECIPLQFDWSSSHHKRQLHSRLLLNYLTKADCIRAYDAAAAAQS